MDLFINHYLIPVLAATTILSIVTIVIQLLRKDDVPLEAERTQNYIDKRTVFSSGFHEIKGNQVQYDKIFQYNPPIQSEEIDSMFVNRESELDKDVIYFHPKINFNQIQVIHGSSRMGKSHYMKKLLVELEKRQRPFWMEYINANSRSQARVVLNDIFKSLKEGINRFAKYNDFENRKDVQLMDYVSIDIDPLVSGEAEEAKFRSVKEFLSSENSENSENVDFSILPDFLNKIIRLKQKTEEDWLLSKLSYDNILDFIKAQATFLVQISERTYRSILLAVDDVDLLYKKDESQKEVDSLLNLLNKLTSSENINIVMTSRKEFANDRRKEMQFFRSVTAMEDDHIKDIYRKHVDFYHNKETVFSEEALEYLIECADGCTGVFLNHCANIFKDLNNKTNINKEGIIESLTLRIKKYSSSEKTKSYFKKIEGIAQTDSLVVKLDKNVQDTDLMFNVIVGPTPSDEYEINKLYYNYYQKKGNK
ncbi:MAG: hypothetical protein HQK75_11325 [Candidatus Magnetomorum sp.]|nr:hypothetical protein [Candidatus Magnetomorum sp.]